MRLPVPFLCPRLSPISSLPLLSLSPSGTQARRRLCRIPHSRAFPLAGLLPNASRPTTADFDLAGTCTGQVVRSVATVRPKCMGELPYMVKKRGP